MGADLIGYLVKGPKELSLTPERRAELIARGERVLDLVRRWDDLGAEERQQVGLAVGPEAIRLLVEDEAEEPFPDADPLLTKSAEQWLADLEELWGPPVGIRDLCRRVDPDDPNQILVFCGDMSWGDPPEGFGYQALLAADYLGYFEALDIR